MPRRPGDAAAGMRPRAAHIKPLHRPAITAVAEHGARRPQLVEAHIAVHDVAAGKPELAFEPLGRQPRLRDDAGAKTRRVLLDRVDDAIRRRSEEHTSELQSLMRISYAVFCLKKKTKYTRQDKAAN